MEAKLETLRSETKRSLMEIRNRLHKTLPSMNRFAEDVRNGMSSAVEDVVNELRSAHSDFQRLLASSFVGNESKRTEGDEFDTETSLTNPEEQSTSSDDEKIECQKDASFLQDTLRRICDRVDEIYREDGSARILDCKCDIDEVAHLINHGESMSALKMIVRNSRTIDDVFKLSAEALERVGGVSPKCTGKLKMMDYAGMCAKYATTQNKSITSFVDDVIYEALLDGEISADDFSDQYRSSGDVETKLARDSETVNENARRFLLLLTKTLIPMTSVILKVCAVIGLTIFCLSPLTATVFCASALMLDTLNEFVKSRMVLDMFETYLIATARGENISDVLSNRYVTMVSEALLHEMVAGTITICHNVSKGNFFKK